MPCLLHSLVVSIITKDLYDVFSHEQQTSSNYELSVSMNRIVRLARKQHRIIFTHCLLTTFLFCLFLHTIYKIPTLFHFKRRIGIKNDLYYKDYFRCQFGNSNQRKYLVVIKIFFLIYSLSTFPCFPYFSQLYICVAAGKATALSLI